MTEIPEFETHQTLISRANILSRAAEGVQSSVERATPLPPSSTPSKLPTPFSRRAWVRHCLATLAALPSAASALQESASASRGAKPLIDTPRGRLPSRIQLPRDHGSHPELRTEWWYITGHSGVPTRKAAPRLGFQLTFFRSRVPGAQGLRSRFAARQLLFAHAAVTDLSSGRLLHDQRIARAGFGLADASERDTDVVLNDWSLQRSVTGSDSGSGSGSSAVGGSRYAARMQGRDFSLELAFSATQPVLLQGNQGLSRKGPAADNLSLYITEPQLAVSGSIILGQESVAVTLPSARAWLDHEASEAILPAGAVGWDWIGMNLDDGSALTAFHLRRQDGSALWAGGSWRVMGGDAQAFGPNEVVFEASRYWSSPASGARYPVAWSVETPVGRFEVHALLDAQELDSRASTGAFYWEGLSELRSPGGGVLGRGYLEMTGYAAALQL